MVLAPEGGRLQFGRRRDGIRLGDGGHPVGRGAVGGVEGLQVIIVRLSRRQAGRGVGVGTRSEGGHQHVAGPVPGVDAIAAGTAGEGPLQGGARLRRADDVEIRRRRDGVGRRVDRHPGRPRGGRIVERLHREPLRLIGLQAGRRVRLGIGGELRHQHRLCAVPVEDSIATFVGEVVPGQFHLRWR